jgi:hypothetical protein
MLAGKRDPVQLSAQGKARDIAGHRVPLVARAACLSIARQAGLEFSGELING